MNLKKGLFQLFKDNQEINSRYEIKSAADVADIYIYDAIGGWFGIIAEEFVRDLANIEAKTVNLYINSPGGDVFDARAINSAIKRHPAHFTAHIDGLAASAATDVALAADKVQMSEGSFFMIHNSWTLALGDKNDLIETAALLENIDQTISGDYQKKTGLEAVEINEFMDNESWFTAEQALNHGFIDEITEGGAVENKYNLAAYENAPEQLTEETYIGRREQLSARLQTLDRLSA
jgi:ATP-dependent Clp protease protease subunit